MKLLTLLLLASCSRPVPMAPLFPQPLPYCFAVHVWFDGGTRQGSVCAESRALCEQASKTAATFGAMGGLTAVGKCEGVK